MQDSGWECEDPYRGSLGEVLIGQHPSGNRRRTAKTRHHYSNSNPVAAACADDLYKTGEADAAAQDRKTQSVPWFQEHEHRPSSLTWIMVDPFRMWNARHPGLEGLVSPSGSRLESWLAGAPPAQKRTSDRPKWCNLPRSCPVQRRTPNCQKNCWEQKAFLSPQPHEGETG